jgi:PAS domain S-box-containing protein
VQAKGVILLVDDDDRLRAATSAIFHRAGFEVVEASDGVEGLDHASSRHFDLIVLDVQLPGISGFEVCRRLKADPRTEAVPVLMLSGYYTDSDHRAEGLETGADGYLTKPCRMRELLATSDALIRIRRAEQALRESEERYRSLVASIPDVVWTFDVTGRPVYISPGAERMIGFSADELLAGGSTMWLRRIHRDSVATVVRAFNILVTRGDPLDVEFRFRRSDGAWIWLHSRAVTVREADGMPVVNGVTSDVTERNWAAELMAARARQSALAADVGAALTSDRPLTVVLGRCVSAMVRHLDAAFARIWTLRDDENVLELQASAGLYTHLDGTHARVPVGALEIGRIAQERRPQVTNDLRHDPLVTDPAWVRREKMVAFAGYPLVVGDRLVGVVALFSRKAIPEFALAALAAAVDMIALGIDRRRAADALRAAQDHLSVGLLSNTLDLDQIIGRLIDITRSVLGGDLVEIWVRDGVTGDLVQLFKTGDIQDVVPRYARVAPGQGLPGWILVHKQPVVLADVTGDARVINPAWLEAEGIVSFLGVPLLMGGEPIGTLSCLTRTRREWTKDDLARAESLATHATVALRNARLFRESEQRRRAAEGLGAVGRLVSQTLDLREVEERVVDSVSKLFGGAMAALYRIDPATEDIVLRKGIGLPADWINVVKRGTGTVGLAIEERHAVATTDALADPRIAYDADTRGRMARSEYRALLAAPLLGQERVIGALVVGDRVGRVFTAEEVALAQAFADQAAIAVHNAQLYEQVNTQVHELERLANAVIESGRTKEEFLVSVSHELGTPLTAIKAYVDTLSADPKVDLRTRREFLGVLQSEVDRLARLIGNILDASRLEMGRLDFRMTPFDLEALVASIVREAQPRRVVIVRSSGPLPVSGDADRVKQVMVNLLDNAMKFSPPEEPVVVVAGIELEHAVVRVFDHGPGVPEDAEAELFEKFARGGRPSGMQPSGSGLGLYLARQIVSMHGGHIAFERHEGWGAVFVVTLPLRGGPQ